MLNGFFFNARRIFSCWKEIAARQKWRKNTARRQRLWGAGHAEADQVPGCWSSHFSWTPFVGDHTILNSNQRKTRPEPELPGTKLLRQSGSVCILSRLTNQACNQQQPSVAT
jgi:hypothetical protein